MNRLHLTTFTETGRCDPPFNPDRCSFRWNKDFTAYRATALRWWDDASYADYQAADIDDTGAYDEESPATVAPASLAPLTQVSAAPCGDDDIPF